MNKFAIIAGVIALSGCSETLTLLGIGQNNVLEAAAQCDDDTIAANSQMSGQAVEDLRCGPQSQSPSETPIDDSPSIFDIFRN